MRWLGVRPVCPAAFRTDSPPGAAGRLPPLLPVPRASARCSWRTPRLLHQGQLTHPGLAPPSVPEAAGLGEGLRGSPPGTERGALLPLSVPARRRHAHKTSPAPAGPGLVSQGVPRRPPRIYPHREPGEKRHRGSRAHAPRISPGFGFRGSASAPHNCTVPESARGVAQGSALPVPCAFSLGCFSLLKNTVIKEDPQGNETQNTVLRYHRSSDFQYPIPQKNFELSQLVPHLQKHWKFSGEIIQNEMSS